jgi:hypothetical protein
MPDRNSEDNRILNANFPFIRWKNPSQNSFKNVVERKYPAFLVQFRPVRLQAFRWALLFRPEKSDAGN